MKKRTLIALLSAVMLISSAAFGTIAYLTATTPAIVNTFTVGNVLIKLDETVVTPDGKPADEPPVRASEGNEYHLFPGATYTKDPMITVLNGSEDSYVRMLVTINNRADLTAIFGGDFLPQNYVTGWDNTVWPCASVKDNGDDTVTYEFRYFETVSAPDGDLALDPLFDTFTIPGAVQAHQLQTLSDLEIEVVGQAIQSVGFEGETDPAEAAWTAFSASTTTTSETPAAGETGATETTETETESTTNVPTV